MASFEHQEVFEFQNEIRSRWCVSDEFVIWKVSCWPFVSYQDYLNISRAEFYRKRVSINKEVNDCNVLEESLICQRVVYDILQVRGKEIYEIEIDQELRKSCLLSYQKDKEEINRKADEVKTANRFER